MFGECHAHIFMDGENYKNAVLIHKNGVSDENVRAHLSQYEKRGISFIRDGGDVLGVSARAKELAGEYGIDYRTPVFAIHKNGYYGNIVGQGFDNMKEYHQLVKKAGSLGADFIKIMISGIMDFSHPGILSCPSLSEEEIREMIHIAHQEGFSVMIHANGKEAVMQAAQYGADSIEHGNFINREVLTVMAEHQTLYVPTISTIANLLRYSRFPHEEVSILLHVCYNNLRIARQLQVPTALGSDAGAFGVAHGQGLLDEYQIFQKILSPSSSLDEWLQEGEKKLQKKFQRE